MISAPYHLHAEKADFDGNELTLTQNVEMTHPLGHLASGRALLTGYKKNSRMPFSHLELEDNVRLRIEMPERKVEISSDKMEGELDAGALLAFSSLQCQGAIVCRTSDGFVATGGFARYSALLGHPGAIELFGGPLQPKCALLREGDRIDADKARFELATQKMSCDGAEGLILSASPIAFRAEKIVWQEGEILLTGDVRLDQQELSLLSDSIRLVLTADNNLQTALVEGPSQLFFPDARLLCEKKLDLHAEEQLLRTEGPLLFQDERITVEATGGSLCYTSLQGRLRPETLLCDGPVKMVSTKIQDQESFALADKLAYFPATRTILLSTTPPRRVLFWQASGDALFSAPQVQVRFDPKTRRESIEGIGDVRFAFDLEERNLIETLFAKYL